MIPAFVARIFGTLTLLYVAVTLCCTGSSAPLLASGADPDMTTADVVVIVACSVFYLGGLIPAFLGLFASPFTLSAHVGWALLVLCGEALSTTVYWFTHPEEFWISTAISVPIFCVWPVLCLVVLPLCRRPIAAE